MNHICHESIYDMFNEENHGSEDHVNTHVSQPMVFACNTVFIVINTVYVPLTVPGVRAVDLVSDYL